MSSEGNNSDEDSHPSSGEASPSAVDNITLPAVKGYITDHGGRVKHTDIVNFFRRQLSDPAAKGRNRADFKDILSRIASFRNESGERYIILKKNCSISDTSPNGRRRQNDRAGNSPDQNHFRDARFGSDSTLASQSTEASCDSGIVLDSQSLASHVAARARDISRSTDSLDDELMADLYDDEGVEDHIVQGHSEFSDEEKRWLMLAAICDCQQLAAMMDQNPGLSGKRDFITSALHWGAKLGRRDMVRLIADSGADINARAGGQTALHLAAMQGHDMIIKMLVNDYGADVHARDYAGKKPKDLVKDTVAPDIQRKLGRSLILGLNRPIIRRHSNVTLSAKVIKRKAAERARWRRSQNPNIHLVSGVTRRAKSDHFTRVENSQDSDGAYTPETRRRLRTMSFLKKKKKWPPEKSESDDEVDKRKRRPKSSIVVLTPDVIRKYSEHEQTKIRQEQARPASTYEF